MPHTDSIDGSRATVRLSWRTLLRDNAILAICYFIAGCIGISLAVPPGYATIVWPASGVALCALLVRGGRMWPGIWFGSFSLNALNSFDGSAQFADSLLGFAIAALLGVGASLQAMAGLAMARRFLAGFELSEVRRVFVATVPVIIVPCVIAPSIGVVTLLAAGTVDVGLVPHNWLTWYFGDVLGVILVMPILLLSNRSPVTVRWRGRSLQGVSSLVAISLMATLLLTFYAWRFIAEREYDQAEANFVEMAANTEEALQHRLQIYQRALQAGAAFAATDGEVTPSEWQKYVDRMQIARTYPGMRGFGMFEAVADKNLPAFRQWFSNEFGTRFQIHPQVEREQHFVINRIEPLATNMAALGLDLAFEQGRRQAILRSMTRRDPILTRPIVLVQDAQQGAGFLMMLPVLTDAGGLTGRWVYSPLVAQELFSALTAQQGDQFRLEVYYGDKADPEALLYTSGEEQPDAKFVLSRTVTLAGQPISLRWSSLRTFEQNHSSSAPAIALTSGFAITILLGVLLVIFMRRESHVVQEVKTATAELEDKNRMLEMAEATAHIGHWHLDLTEDRLSWSDEVHRLHGLLVDDTPDLARAFEFYHEDDRAIVVQAIEAATKTYEQFSFKARLMTADDQMRHVEVRGNVDANDEGVAVAIFGVIIDRTDETIMRERLTKTIEEARAANTAKSSFLANMSHEIRTPMNGVIGFTELALAEETSPVQRRRLQMIADSSNAMLRLLNDLLDFAKIEAKQMAIVNEPADLRHTLRSCQRLMEPVAMSRDLSLVLDVDKALPAQVVIDKMRLRQIVLNLVGNALKFTEKGEVRITATVARRRSDERDAIILTVRDTGIGIPADRLDSIFEKFTQADDTTARRYGGTGLGLPISAELAKLMGGTLRAESEPGVGSAFTLFLPLQESGAAQAVETNVAAAEPLPAGGEGKRLRILVAEDNPINQELTTAMVKKAGHDCELAYDGEEAVEAALTASREGNPFDLVLMDIQMPRMDGLQAARAIRDAGIDPQTLPILAVTANAYSDDINRCKDAGMQAHLAKPLRLGELRSAIAEWSQPRQAEPVASAGAYEAVTNPRLQALFDSRKVAAIEAIDAVLQDGEKVSEAKTDIASLLHQIAGVAAYFGQEALGETCRRSQHELVATRNDDEALAIIIAMRDRLSETNT